MNPFFETYNTPFGTIPFSQIKLDHFLPAAGKGIIDAKAEIEEIISNKAEPTFENTIVALENAGELLDKVTTAFFNLNSAETNPEMQALAQEISPLLSTYRNDVMLNAELFARVKKVFENGDKGFTEEQKMLLDKSYKSFARNGANLAAEDQDKLRKIDEELARLSLTFGENVLQESNAFSMVLDNEADLDGLPDGIKEAAAHLAEEKELTGKWIFTLDYPSYIPFMTYATNRALREKMYKAFSSKAFQANEHNNEENIHRIVSLRAERAQLLGFKSHADYVLAERMAKNPETVFSFLDDMQEKALPFAKKNSKFLANTLIS